MRQATHLRFTATALLLLACGAARPAESQTASAAATKAQSTSAGPATGKEAMLQDTDHLLQLARQLKASVDRTRRDELSLQVVREADEIEKLARSVKARIH